MSDTKVEFAPVADDVREENKRLSKKNFDLARSLAAAQRRMTDQEQNLHEIKNRQDRWVEDMQGDLAFVCQQLVAEQESRLEAFEGKPVSYKPLADGDISGAIRRASEIREKLKQFEASRRPAS